MIDNENMQLPYFPAQRPDGMDMEEFKKARKDYQKLIKLHKRLGYKFVASKINDGMTHYSLIRQAKKFEKNGYAKTIRNEDEYFELYKKIYDMAFNPPNG